MKRRNFQGILIYQGLKFSIVVILPSVTLAISLASTTLPLPEQVQNSSSVLKIRFDKLCCDLQECIELQEIQGHLDDRLQVVYRCCRVLFDGLTYQLIGEFQGSPISSICGLSFKFLVYEIFVPALFGYLCFAYLPIPVRFC